MTQDEQRARWREEYRKRHPRKPPVTFYHPKQQRMVIRDGLSMRIAWSKQMADDLRRYFPCTLNEELSGILGVSVRTVIRKARELGLKKDPEWLRKVWNERRLMAHAVSKSKGYPGAFQKGVRSSIATEFKKGHRLTDEQMERKRNTMKDYCLTHKSELRKRGLKAWETRRMNEKNS